MATAPTGVRQHVAPRPAAVLPLDAPFASAAGPDPDRILLIGDAVVAGGGATRHADALAGRLAEALSVRTGRGALVDQRTRPDCRAVDLEDLLRGARLDRYDAVVLAPGTLDAAELLPAVEWERSLVAVVERLRSATQDAALVVLGVPRLSADDRPAGLRGLRVDRRTRRMDGLSSAFAARSTRVVHVAAAADGPDRHARWAEDVADGIRPHLADAAARPAAVADPERERMAALVRTGLAGPRRDGRFESLAAAAQEQMGAEIAAVSFIGEDSQWFHAIRGSDLESYPRSLSLCSTTIMLDGPVVKGDLHTDPELDAHPLVHGDPPLRFYAGCPVESPDGYRIGTVCVFGTEPRDPASVDLAPLQRLAAEARARIWAGADES